MLPSVKASTSFENADTGFSRQDHHVGCIATEPLVVPTRVVVYIEERNAPPTKAVFYSRIPTRGLESDTASHIIILFGWAPAISKMTFTGFQCAYSIYRCQ